MDKDILDMFNLLIDKMDGMEKRLEEKLDEKLEKKLDEKLDEKLGQTERRIMIYAENNITKRLDALADGYKQNYEQNDITDTRVDMLDDKVGTLEDRVTLLEHAG